jgi:hypothetical protein
MSKGDLVTDKELTPEPKQKFDEIKALFEADLIGSFERTRHHDIRWKGFSPEGALDGVDLSLPNKRAHQHSAPRSQLHGSSFSASAHREPSKRF